MTTHNSEQTNPTESQSPKLTLTISPRIIVGFMIVMLVLALTAVVPKVLASGDVSISHGRVAAPNAPEAFSSSGTINFQGELTQVSGGSAVPDGDYKMRFAIYDAGSSGNKKWPSATYEEQTVTVSGGLFNTHLGAVEIDIDEAFTDGGDRYLQIWACTTAGAGCSSFDDLGRLPISSTGYAQSLIPGAKIDGGSNRALTLSSSGTSGNALLVEALNGSGNAAAINATSSSNNGAAFSGYNSQGGYGLYASSATGIAVYGSTGDHTGFNAGVYGTSGSSYGSGVYGTSPYTGIRGVSTIITGTAFGAYGSSASTDGYGLYGTAPMTGTMGVATDEYGIGVYGLASVTTGSGVGIYGVSNAEHGTGLLGSATATTGNTAGIYGVTHSSSSFAYGPAGVYGWAAATSGVTKGVLGKSDSNEGTGVFGVADSASGANIGVSGYTNSSNSGSVGVRGSAQAGVGVSAISDSGNPIEAYGSSIFDIEFKVSNTGNVYADGSYSTPAADFAEMLPAVDGLEPADVLIINLDGKLAQSTEAYQLTVAGVYSTDPGFLGGQADDDDPTGKVPLAIVGVVPVKVSGENGAIQPGDLLVASDTPGHAMKAGDNPPNCTVIGKALEAFDGDAGAILILVILQ